MIRLDEKIRDYLPDMTVERDVPMSRHTSFRIGGPARRMAFPESREQLVILLGLAEECGIRPFLLGRGTNLLVSDRGLDTAGHQNGGAHDEHPPPGRRDLRGRRRRPAQPPGGISPSRRAWPGWNLPTASPAAVGGAVCMNAGAYGGEMAPGGDGGHRPVPDDGIRRFTGDQAEFAYRHSRFLEDRSRGAGGRGAPDPGRSRRPSGSGWMT